MQIDNLSSLWTLKSSYADICEHCVSYIYTSWGSDLTSCGALREITYTEEQDLV